MYSLLHKSVLISALLFTMVLKIHATTDATSPNGLIHLSISDGKMVVSYRAQTVLTIPAIGLGESPAASVNDFQFVRNVTDDYVMLHGKRLHCTNRANEYAVDLSVNQRMVVRLYDDGIALRYELSDLSSSKQPTEHTAYLIADGTRRWMQRWSDAYEGFFPLTTSAPADGRWGYPALIEPADGVFALITEADVEIYNSASCLYNKGDVYAVVQDANDTELNGTWHTPWRVIIVGSLADVVESTLVTDLASPNRLDDTSWIHPGVVSWVYWAYNHGSNDYNIICKYVDLAVSLHLTYVLIDAEWDEMKDGKSVEDAVAYAKAKGVKPLIWYNSSVGWVNGAPGPKYRLNKPEDREREFAWCERIGVAGVKIDFFSGDSQMNMSYCIDLLQCAARHHLMVNFHGATIPRGWQRTYPNLMSTEGVYGAEWYNNVPTFTNRAASHNATLPFTRNVVGPMDYTPCAFSDSQHPHITTHAHELALTVLFESGLQHLADRPESFLAQPAEVQQFLGALPAAWDDTRLIAGYPGDYAVIARRAGKVWYVAGINGHDEPLDIVLPTDRLPRRLTPQTAFLDSGSPSTPWDIRTDSKAKMPKRITLQPRGGFLFILKEK